MRQFPARMRSSPSCPVRATTPRGDHPVDDRRSRTAPYTPTQGGAPEVDPAEAALLFAAGYDAEDITDMNPEERAAEVAEALTQGVEPIDEADATHPG